MMSGTLTIFIFEEQNVVDTIRLKPLSFAKLKRDVQYMLANETNETAMCFFLREINDLEEENPAE